MLLDGEERTDVYAQPHEPATPTHRQNVLGVRCSDLVQGSPGRVGRARSGGPNR